MVENKQCGSLYLISTPIGNLGDITNRALETLQKVQYVAAENIRHTRKLFNHYGINAKMFQYNDHNESKQAEYIIQLMKSGNDIGLVSDAGTPLICDPGYRIVNLARQQQLPIIAIPGACALITALSVSGLPTDRFSFLGFLPSQSTARKKKIEEMLDYPHTWIVYESPHRIINSLKDIALILSDDRHIVVVRELTKTFETIKSGTVAQILAEISSSTDQQRGEFVLIIKGKEDEIGIDNKTKYLLTTLLEELTIKKATTIAAQITGVSKKILYNYALELKNNNAN